MCGNTFTPLPESHGEHQRLRTIGLHQPQETTPKLKRYLTIMLLRGHTQNLTNLYPIYFQKRKNMEGSVLFWILRNSIHMCNINTLKWTILEQQLSWFPKMAIWHASTSKMHSIRCLFTKSIGDI